MRIKSSLARIMALTISIFIFLSMFIPILVSASSLTDSAKKIILNTIEDIEKYVDEDRYPKYKERLIALKKANPNWKFTLYYTGIEWKNAIYNETKVLHGRSLVQGKVGEWICDACGNKVYDAGGWLCASEKAVAYLMDARNYLSEQYIFQFEELSYNPEIYTIEGIEKVLNGTFMYRKSIQDYYNNINYANITFAEAIMEASKSSGVSPYYLAARIRQEIGINGSDSIYGTNKGYEETYNFYNKGANSGEDPNGNGLKYASKGTIGKYLLPWDDPVKAIKGGAIWIATNYISVGQDTLYFQKYDVVRNGTLLYNHQYMQNIFAAKSEGYTTHTTYSKLGLLDNNYNFIIPIYENMPESLSLEPKNQELNTQTGLDEKVQITGNNVILRSYPSTLGSIVVVLKKDTIATRIEKNSSYEDGYYWDKIKLSNGTIGYIANKYLSTIIQSDNTSTVKTESMKINANNVRIRKSPTTASKIVSTLSKNTEVIRLEKKVAYKNGYHWDKVKLSDGRLGYVATNYLSSKISSNTSSSMSTKKAKINASNVRLRKSAGTSAKILKTLSKGVTVTILKKKAIYKNGYYWDKVKLANGTIGYIATKYLS